MQRGSNMNWVEVLGFIASGAVFVTFWMKTLIPLRIIGIASNLLFFSYGLNADLTSITLLHGFLFPLNCLRLYQAMALRRRIHDMAHSEYDVKSLLPMMSEHKIPGNKFLFERGDAAHNIYYLAKGKAHIVELEIDIDPGHLVGEIAIFTPDKKRTQSIKCVENCIFLAISEEKVLQMYAQNPEFGLYLIKMAVDRLLTNALNNTAKLSRQFGS